MYDPHVDLRATWRKFSSVKITNQWFRLDRTIIFRFNFPFFSHIFRIFHAYFFDFSQNFTSHCILSRQNTIFHELFRTFPTFFRSQYQICMKLSDDCVCASRMSTPRNYFCLLQELKLEWVHTRVFPKENFLTMYACTLALHTKKKFFKNNINREIACTPAADRIWVKSKKINFESKTKKIRVSGGKLASWFTDLRWWWWYTHIATWIYLSLSKCEKIHS